ncbi:hypothetical protein HPB48_005998 [Haemaphysalis longicornis]|uniref:Uncharacterized protein n=1 Tax=Haemaphysalis longicornis TaxID=44386 RepID=A0A9J6FK83_HAELO|nr:hypothetical protein HPB48_005998 [Haemaphysalis longicornis]
MDSGDENSSVVDQRALNSDAGNNYYIDQRIREIRKFFSSKGVGLDDACTDTAGRRCWLCANPTPWNRLLAPLSLELVESGPGKLSLRSVNVESRNLNDVNALYDGAYVFTWLPKQHRCVQTICLHDNVLFQKPAYSLKLTLGSSANLRHLKLKGAYSTLFNEQELSDGLESLTALESFEFLKLDVTHMLASSIAALLRRNKAHLAKVGFKRNALSQRSTATLLSALIECKALTELSFDHNNLAKPNELKLQSCEAPLGPLFAALETNTTLRHLDLDSCTMSAAYATGLANALRCNKALRRVVLQHCSVDDVAAEKLADAVVENSALETLDLSENRVNIQGIAAFCAALKKNKTLKTVSFGMFHATEEERRDLAHLLSRSDCCGRIMVPWANPDLPPLTATLALASQSPSEVSLSDITEFSSTLVCELFDTLASNTEVKTLKVEARGYEADKADALCRALTANQSIKSLELQLNVESLQGSLIVGVTKALMVNTTVTELIIYTCDISLHSSKTFASMLAQNKTLTTIALYCRHLGTKRLEMLSRGMIHNSVVISFTFGKALPRNRAAFRLHECVRRNVGLLNMAVQFVLQADVTKRCAQAFETLRWTSSLVSQVAKVSGKSEPEAVAALDAAEKYIRSHYLFVTGVVREAVRCYPGMGKQADALNDYCWQAIAEYLRVSDVLDG